MFRTKAFCTGTFKHINIMKFTTLRGFKRLVREGFKPALLDMGTQNGKNFIGAEIAPNGQLKSYYYSKEYGVYAFAHQQDGRFCSYFDHHPNNIILVEGRQRFATGMRMKVTEYEESKMPSPVIEMVNDKIAKMYGIYEGHRKKALGQIQK